MKDKTDVGSLVENDNLKMIIDSVFSFGQLQETMKRSKSAKATGRVIISIMEEKDL